MQQAKTVMRFQLGETLDQFFLQAVVLIRLRIQLAGVDLVFQPQPLEEGRLIQRGWRIGVVLQQLRRVDAVVGQIETRVQRRLVGAPELRTNSQVFRDAELGHQLVAANHFFHHLQAHLVQLGGGAFDLQSAPA